MKRAQVVGWWLLGIVATGALCFGVKGCIDRDDRIMAEQKYEREFGPCFDHSELLATTTGSPNGHSCENHRQRMHVQVQTVGAEEIGALIFCQCMRDGGAP